MCLRKTCRGNSRIARIIGKIATQYTPHHRLRRSLPKSEKPLKGSAEMKKKVLIILNALLIIPFLIFFRRGGNVAIFMLPVWFVMTIVNTICSKDIKQLLIYNVLLSLFATLGIFVCGQLYFKYVYWDSIGETIILLEIAIEVIYISILTAIESFVRCFVNKKMK